MQQRTSPRPINYWLYLGIPLATALALILLELTSVDMDVANLFFDPAAGQFIGRHSYLLENILHDRVKQVVILLGVISLLTFAASFFWKRLFGWRRELGCLALALGLSTAFVTPLKKSHPGAVPLEPDPVWRHRNLQQAAGTTAAYRQAWPVLAGRACSDRFLPVRLVLHAA